MDQSRETKIVIFVHFDVLGDIVMSGGHRQPTIDPMRSPDVQADCHRQSYSHLAGKVTWLHALFFKPRPAHGNGGNNNITRFSSLLMLLQSVLSSKAIY